MDAYSKMRQEIVTALKNNNLTVDDVLNVIDTISINYDIIPRERSCKTAFEILDEYLSCCEYEKMSAGTIENYQLVINALLNSLCVSINKIRTTDLRNYLRNYQNERGIADSTLNKYREYFRAFFQWCVNEGYIERNPAAKLKLIRCEKKQREYYTQVEYTYKNGEIHRGYVTALYPDLYALNFQSPTKHCKKVNARKCKLLWKYSKIYWLENVG